MRIRKSCPIATFSLYLVLLLLALLGHAQYKPPSNQTTTQATASTATSTPAILKSNASPRKPGAESVVISTFRPGNLDVFYFSHPGEQPRRLTDDPGLDYDPVLSPDGRWVVYTSEQSGRPHLYALDLQNGGPPKLLIDGDHMQDQAAFTADGKSIAFVSARDGTADIFILPFKPETTQSMDKARNLTHHPGGEFRPAISPDGRKVAFTTDWDVPPTGQPAARTREGEIYIMDIDGSNVQRLTHSPGWDGSPTWSRDGKIIYFYSERDGEARIWAMDANGANPRPISPQGIKALSPALTSDGRIAFSALTGEIGTTSPVQAWRIASVTPDGSDFRFESDLNSVINYWVPKFSEKTEGMVVYAPGPPQMDVPQGEVGIGDGPLLVPHSPIYVDLPDRTLAIYAMRSFSVSIDPTGTKVVRTDSFRVSHYIMVSNLDGSDEHIVYTRPKGGHPLYAPTFSKDGQWIAWMDGFAFGGIKQEADIWKMRLDGSGMVDLTPNSPGNDGFMDFSGDGRFIVFRSSRTGDFDVFLMNSDGTNQHNLTSNPAYDAFPAYSPVANEIAFASNREGDLDEKTGMRTFEIYTMKINDDGSPGEIRRITDSPGQDCHPQYSPDGKWLVFTSERGGINDEEPVISQVFPTPQPYGEIYAVRLSDGFLVRLTENKWEDGIPTWGKASPAQSGTFASKK